MRGACGRLGTPGPTASAASWQPYLGTLSWPLPSRDSLSVIPG